MFGDYFGQRADYSSGLFYSGHRKYLNEKGSSSLDAPYQFKTRKTARNLRLTAKKESSSQSFPAAFKMMTQRPLLEETCPSPHHRRRLHKTANLVVGTIILEHAVLDQREKADWIEKSEAGVKMWVNIKTGEVLTHNPFEHEKNSILPAINNKAPQKRLSLSKTQASVATTGAATATRRHSSISIRRTRSKSVENSHAISDVMGTASLVYDREPVKELFELLDHFAAKKK